MTETWTPTPHIRHRRLRRQMDREGALHKHLAIYHSMPGHPTPYLYDHGNGAWCPLNLAEMRFLHADQHWPRRGLPFLAWRPWLRLLARGGAT